MIFIKTY